VTNLAAFTREFTERFSSTPQLFRAPGRVNLIGEHTDYNAGFVMPVAIQFSTTVAIAPRDDRRLCVRSTNMAETCGTTLVEGPVPSPREVGKRAHWFDYVLGVAYALQQHGLILTGADLLVHGEVPIGAGLSSSAALEIAVALALASVSGWVLDKITLARIGQQAENNYVGMRCGIMDQFAAACGLAGHALKIDCRSLDHELVPLVLGSAGSPDAAQLVVCNTMVRHSHASGEYNRRREECEEAVLSLQRVLPGIKSLRDLTLPQLHDHGAVLDPVVYRRARHIVTENARVLAAAEALKTGALETFGKLMCQSHESLRDDYEVSCQELDLMVRLAEGTKGVYGARMTGGGFGGCTVNLVRTANVRTFRSNIATRYAVATGHTPEIYVCQAVDGAGPVHSP
jgi:galactokinase